MTATVSPELERMAARCRLPISIRYRVLNHQQRRSGARDCFMLSWPTRHYANRETHAEATRAYVALRAEMESS